MSRTKNSKSLPRLLITLLGIAFIAWGISIVMLGYIGVKETALITHIRREGGERNETIPGQYTYNISYTFTLPNGKSVSGVTKKIGDATYLKVDGKSKVSVKYFSFFPYINAMEKDTKLGFGQLILVGTGCLLIFLINRRSNK